MKITTPPVLQRIRDVVKDTVTPSWVRSVPSNFGEASAGTLKADEWRTMMTIYLPIALISLWGAGSSHPSSETAARFRKILDHTMSLVMATRLICMRTTSRSRAHAYHNYVLAWVKDLTDLHPHATHRVNHHMALHIHEFLLLFGPVRSWWTFPFERLIGLLERLPKNSKFGKALHFPVLTSNLTL
jgi:hypothetical protein